MQTIWLKIVEDLNASVGVLLIILIGLGFLIYKFGIFKGKWDAKSEDLSLLKKQYDESFPFLKERINLIFQHTYPKAAIKTSSPAELTEIGKKIVDSLDAPKIIEKNKQNLESFIEEEKVDNAYDLQKSCFSVIEKNGEKLLNSQQLDMAKDLSVEYGIPLSHTLSVFAVLLRDTIIKSKGWKLGDIDKNKSNKLSLAKS